MNSEIEVHTVRLRWGRKQHGALIALSWAMIMSLLWMPAFGAVVIACRPWSYTEQRFGFCEYYLVHYSENGDYLERINPQGMVITVAFTIILTAICIWRYKRFTLRGTQGN